jgi:hypothetical protein
MSLLDQQQIVDEMNGEGLQVPPDIEPVEFLMAIYRDPRQPMNRRMKAAIEAAQYRQPKLGVIATTNLSGHDFAALLDRAIERSNGARVVKALPKPEGGDAG